MGYILMGAGALGLIATMLLINQRSHTSHTSVEERRNINE
jgi:hypothetical protein